MATVKKEQFNELLLELKSGKRHFGFDFMHKTFTFEQLQAIQAAVDSNPDILSLELDPIPVKPVDHSYKAVEQIIKDTTPSGELDAIQEYKLAEEEMTELELAAAYEEFLIRNLHDYKKAFDEKIEGMLLKVSALNDRKASYLEAQKQNASAIKARVGLKTRAKASLATKDELELLSERERIKEELNKIENEISTKNNEIPLWRKFGEGYKTLVDRHVAELGKTGIVEKIGTDLKERRRVLLEQQEEQRKAVEASMRKEQQKQAGAAATEKGLQPAALMAAQKLTPRSKEQVSEGEAKAYANLINELQRYVALKEAEIKSREEKKKGVVTWGGHGTDLRKKADLAKEALKNLGAPFPKTGKVNPVDPAQAATLLKLWPFKSDVFKTLQGLEAEDLKIRKTKGELHRIFSKAMTAFPKPPASGQGLK